MNDIETSYVYKKMDWDYNVIDVFLIVDNCEYYIKGFDDFEWSEAEKFAKTFAKSLNIEYIGDNTDT